MIFISGQKVVDFKTLLLSQDMTRFDTIQGNSKFKISLKLARFKSNLLLQHGLRFHKFYPSNFGICLALMNIGCGR